MDGQADTAPVTADDVAAFLLDNPDAAGAGDQEEVKPTADAPEGEEPEDNADANKRLTKKNSLQATRGIPITRGRRSSLHSEKSRPQRLCAPK